MQNPINGLIYHNTMIVEDVLSCMRENELILELSLNEYIIESVIEIKKKSKVEDDSVDLEQVSRKNALKETITLHHFLLQYENYTLDFLNALIKVIHRIFLIL